MTSQISHVLFDLDGTLVDSLPGIEFATRRAMESLGLAPPPYDIRSLIGPPIRDILETASGIHSPERLSELEQAFRLAYDSEGWRRTVLYPEVRETLAALVSRGIRCFVITNKPRVPTGRILDYLELSTYFTEVLCPDHRQPAFLTKAEAALEIRSRYGLRGEAMLLAGDSRDDAHAAHTCGCAFAAIEYGYGAAATQRDYPVHFVAGRIGQLLELLFPLERDMPSVTGQAVPSSSPL